MRKIIALLLFAATGAFGFPASAAIVDYYISGEGTGVLSGIDWSGDFLITMVGDNSTVQTPPGLEVIDPLESASVTIPGPITATLSIATRLGLGSNNAIFFSRAGSSGHDLFDFTISPTDAAAFHFQTGYGPVPNTGPVYALNQFEAVATSKGPLTFSSSGDVLFSSSGARVIPEPSTWVMMLAGFAGLGFAGYRASRKSVAVT
jgi:hypothetical protein